jgi:hypothetical protein
MAHAYASAYHTWTGNFDTADRSLDHVITNYDADKHGSYVDVFNHDPLCFAKTWRGHRLWMRGFPIQATQVALEQVALARPMGHPFNLIWSLTGGVFPFVHCGDTATYADCIGEARAIAAEQGLGFLDDIVCSFWNGMGLIVAEKYKAGLDQVGTGCRLWRDSGGVIQVPLAQMMMAYAFGQIGELERAMALIEEAIALIKQTGHASHQPEAFRIKGVLLLLGDANGAEGATECFQHALQLARATGTKGWELRAAASLARLWQSQGKHQEAHELLAPVYDWFTEGFETADLKDAKALLERLR